MIAFEAAQVLQARLHAAMSSLEKAIGETARLRALNALRNSKPSLAPSPLSTMTQ